MALGVLLLTIAILVVVVWLLFKSIKHGLLAILFLFLIVLILFSFFTLNSAFNGKGISLNSVSDIGKEFKIYFSWLGTAFEDIKSITGNVIKTHIPVNNTS